MSLPPPPSVAPVLQPSGKVAREWLLWFLRVQRESATGGTGTPSSTVAALDGTSAAGSASTYSRGDHKHADTARHTHANKATLDKITESGGLPLWNAGTWPGTATAWGSITGTLASQTDLNTALAGKLDLHATADAAVTLAAGADRTKLDGIAAGANVGVVPNGAITGATKTKISYDTKGLVTAGVDATTADVADSTDKRYITDAQRTVLGSLATVATSGSYSDLTDRPTIVDGGAF